MNATMIAQMQNVMGCFAQYIYLGRYDLCAELFATNEKTALNLPDSKQCFRGSEAIHEAFFVMQKKLESKYLPREIYVYNTPVFRAEGDFGCGTWEAFTFRCKEQDADGKMLVEPAFCRFDCDFVMNNGAVKIQRMDWYQLMNWLSWICTEIAFEKAIPLPVSANCNHVNAEDFVQVERLISRFSHTNREEASVLFARGESTKFYLSAHMQQAAIGYEKVLQAIDDLKQKEIDNSGLYICVPYATAPMITISDDAQRASGTWLTMSFDLQGLAYGIEKEKACAVRRIGMLQADFVCQNNKWRIERYEYLVRESSASIKLRSMETCSWRPAVKATGNKTCAEDIFEIQGLMLEWTERLKWSINGIS